MLDATSSSSSMTSPHAAGMFGPKIILGTTVKLNGSNYLLWAQNFRIFICAQNKSAHLLESSHVASDTTYKAWLSGKYYVMTWLLNSLEKINVRVMFLSTAKEM